MKGKNKVIILGVIVVGLILGSFISSGIKGLLEKPFPIRNAGVSAEEYAMALEKIDTFAEELKDMDLDNIQIIVWDDENSLVYDRHTRNYEIYIDCRASAEKMKDHLIKVKARIRVNKKIDKLIKELKKKGLFVADTTFYCENKENFLIGLEKLSKLSSQEIKDLKIEGIKIYIHSKFKAFPRRKDIFIDYRAPFQKIKTYITKEAFYMKKVEKQKKEKEELREIIRERNRKAMEEAEKEAKKKIENLKKSIRKKLGK